jgi:hypothetical protein
MNFHQKRMVSETYPSPVNKLLTYADCSKLQELPNYIEEFRFGKEHIPDLIRMATDKNLHDADPDSLEVWAPLHACRALGQLRATEAIEPLITLFHEVYESWSYIDLPLVFGLIGESAIPSLRSYLADDSREVNQRFAAASSLTSIAENYPDVRNECVNILTQQLERFAVNEPEYNAILIQELIKLNAIESALLIEKAFTARKVDTMLAGNWDNVQVSLGLKKREEVSRFDEEIDSMTAMLNSSIPQPLSQQPKGFFKSSSQKKIKKKKR